MITEDFLSDIKTLFDWFRNVAICAALMIGLPRVEEYIVAVSGSPLLGQSATLFFVAIIFALYILNFVWLICSLKVKPKSKAIHVVGGIVIITLVTLSLAGVAVVKVWVYA